jgi:hypothetical protein
VSKRFSIAGFCSAVLVLSLVVIVTAQEVRSEPECGAALQADATLADVDWTQVTASGFGYPTNSAVLSLEMFSGDLYAGVSNWLEGGQVWRTSDGLTWAQVSDLGFESAYTTTNTALLDMIEFDDQLYVGTGWGSAEGQIWRSPDGENWTQIESAGFGDSSNTAIAIFAVFSDTLYAATQSSNGVEIWRSTTGDDGDWSRVVDTGLGDTDNSTCTGLMEFDGYLYAAIENQVDGAEIWRTNDGATWAAVVSGGFGLADNTQTGGFGIFDGYLYIGTRNDTAGGQIWRTNNGTYWVRVVGDGFEDGNNFKIESLMAFGGELYAVTDNDVTGIEVWNSSDGDYWTQVNTDGFGDSENINTLWSVGTAVFNSNLYIGSTNYTDGGEIWATVRKAPFDGWLVLDATDRYAYSPYETEVDLRGGSFTVEMWLKFSDAVYSLSDYSMVPVEQRNGFYLIFGKSTTYPHPPTPLVRCSVNTKLSGSTSIGTTVPCFDNYWHHWAMVYDNVAGEIRVYEDGQFVFNTSEDGSSVMPEYITVNWDGSNRLKYADEIRISDVARYSSAFLPQSASFVCDDHTRALWHFDEIEGSTVFHDACGAVDNAFTGYNGAHTKGVPGYWVYLPLVVRND